LSPFKISSGSIDYQILQSGLSVFFRSILVSILVCASIFLFSPIGYTAQVTLVWEPVNHPDLVGYKIYQGNSSLNYDFPTDAGNWTSCTIGDLLEGETYYFATILQLLLTISMEMKVITRMRSPTVLLTRHQRPASASIKSQVKLR
jgi:hypothetical protein